MKNTMAIVLLIAGAVMLYSGLKGWSFGDTLKYFLGQKPSHTGAAPSSNTTPNGQQPQQNTQTTQTTNRTGSTATPQNSGGTTQSA